MFTKNKKMSLLAVAIVLGVFNVVVFVLPFARSGSFWVGYCFAMLAFLLTAAVGFHSLGRESIKSKFFGMPTVLVAWTYLIVQVIIGVLEMVFFALSFQYSIVINVILLGVCLIGLISTSIGKEEINRIDEKVKSKVFYIKSLQNDIESLVSRVSEPSLKKSLSDLVDTIRYSDPMSSPQLAPIENKIEIKAATLSDSISDRDMAKSLCDELQMLFAERNRKCKLLK